ncbi:hypothetical protein SAMN02744133_10828 [Thalassospira xiamenensis M-5 = DSM 17429]|nr:hypothetical protein [Thalassospira xiamenensis]SIT21022.1 hypothetical protein SAMN02744133_10828 [Thalassospira xiamenensis M-5 = DSM 17429]
MSFIKPTKSLGLGGADMMHAARGISGVGLESAKVFHRRPTPTSWQDEKLEEHSPISFSQLAELEFEHCQDIRATALSQVVVMNEMVISDDYYFGLPACAVYLDQLRKDGYADDNGQIVLNPLDWEIFPELIGFDTATVSYAGMNNRRGEMKIVLAGNSATRIIGHGQHDMGNSSYSIGSLSGLGFEN